jgi:hypothetical protein
LGILIDVEKANKDYAKSLGKTASELTEAEKKQAFTNAVLKEGEDLLNRVGIAGTTMAEKFQIAGASADNFKTSIGEIINMALGDTIGFWISKLNQFSTALTNTLNQARQGAKFDELVRLGKLLETRRGELERFEETGRERGIELPVVGFVPLKADFDPSEKKKLEAEIVSIQGQINAINLKPLIAPPVTDGDGGGGSGGAADKSFANRLKAQDKQMADLRKQGLSDAQLIQIEHEQRMKEIKDGAFSTDEKRILEANQRRVTQLEFETLLNEQQAQQEQEAAEGRLAFETFAWDQRIELAAEKAARMQEIYDRLGQGMTGVWSDTITQMVHGQRVGGKQMLKATGAMFGGILQQEGGVHVARGFAKVFESIWPPNPLGEISGGGEIAKGSAMIALGASMGAGGGGARGGGGGGGGGGGRRSPRAAEPEPTGPQRQVNIFFENVHGNVDEEFIERIVNQQNELVEDQDVKLSSSFTVRS